MVLRMKTYKVAVWATGGALHPHRDGVPAF
jgi:hypothetical protein